MDVQYCEGCFDKSPSYIQIEGLRLCKDCFYIKVYKLIKKISEMSENVFMRRFRHFLETVYKDDRPRTRTEERTTRGFYKSAKEFFAKPTSGTMKNFIKYLFFITPDGFNVVKQSVQRASFDGLLEKLDKLLEILQKRQSQYTLTARDVATLSILTPYKSLRNTPTNGTSGSWIWNPKRKHYTPPIHEEQHSRYSKKNKTTLS